MEGVLQKTTFDYLKGVGFKFFGKVAMWFVYGPEILIIFMNLCAYFPPFLQCMKPSPANIRPKLKIRVIESSQKFNLNM